jgi:hypothetical protein
LRIVAQKVVVPRCHVVVGIVRREVVCEAVLVTDDVIHELADVPLRARRRLVPVVVGERVQPALEL